MTFLSFYNIIVPMEIAQKYYSFFRTAYNRKPIDSFSYHFKKLI